MAAAMLRDVQLPSNIPFIP